MWSAPSPQEARRRLVAGTGLAAAGAALALAGPAVPLCPTHALLGVDCPACGATRGLAALLRGDVAGALDHNLLLAAAVPLAVGLWVATALAAAGRPLPRPGRGALPRPAPAVLLGVLVVALGAFTVLRNAGPPSLAWLDAA